MSDISKILLDGVLYDVKDTTSRPQEIVWNYNYHLDGFVTSGIYNIIGERTNSNDGFPIANASSGHSIHARLTVLDSSIPGTGKEDDKCITQLLVLSNRVGGDGNVYIRTGINSDINNLANHQGWESWALLQTNTEVGLIDSSQLKDFRDNGIYSGVVCGPGKSSNVSVLYDGAYFKTASAEQTEMIKQLGISMGIDSWKITYCYVYYAGNTKYQGCAIGAEEDIVISESIGIHLLVYPNGTAEILENKFGNDVYNNSNDVDLNNETFVLVNINNYAVASAYSKVRSISQFKYGVDLDGNINFKKRVGTGDDTITWEDWENIGNDSKFVEWNSSSDMNNFKTPGVYEIYGERTVKTDNLPIFNDGSGHSIAARLTVIASTLQPNNTEICVTQFLQLSNRIGGEGNTYIRTYNENNNGLNGWSPWQKQMGMVETYINGNNYGFGFGKDGIDSGVGLNHFINNGIYSGIYTDDDYASSMTGTPSFVETFVLIVINDYAASSQAGTPRRISQLKYATDTLTGLCTVKKRVGTGNDTISWGDWEEIGGGGSSEVDITDAIKTYGLPTLVEQGLMQEGVTYVAELDMVNDGDIELDNNNKIVTDIRGTICENGASIVRIEIVKKIINNNDTYIIEAIGDAGGFNRYCFSGSPEYIYKQAGSSYV